MPDADSDEKLNQAFRALRAQRGECLTFEEVEQYLAGEGPGDAARRVEDHLVICASCLHLVERMRAQEELVPPWPAARAAAVERRLKRRFEQFLDSQKPRATHGLRFWIRGPLPAYALAAVLAVPAVLYLVRRPSPPRPARTAEPGITTQATTLFALQPPTRGAEAPRNEVRLTVGQKVFVLSFFLPMKPELSYAARIVNSSGATAAMVSGLRDNGAGNCFVVCNRADFPPGAYTILIVESDPAGREIQRFAGIPFDVAE